jgi:hypothetical protein
MVFLSFKPFTIGMLLIFSVLMSQSRTAEKFSPSATGVAYAK